MVDVFESPETAASARHISGGATKGEMEKEWWDPSAFSDSRLGGGAGETNSQFSNVEWMVFVNNNGVWKKGAALQELHIRYKNIVASFYPTMYTGGVQDFDQYDGGDTCELTAQLARQWLDKVSGIEPPQQADLQIGEKNIFLTYYEDNDILPLEDSADKQQVPENKTGLDLVSFQKIAISSGSKVTGELQTNAAIASLQSSSTENSGKWPLHPLCYRFP